MSLSPKQYTSLRRRVRGHADGADTILNGNYWGRVVLRKMSGDALSCGGMVAKAWSVIAMEKIDSVMLFADFTGGRLLYRPGGREPCGASPRLPRRVPAGGARRNVRQRRLISGGYPGRRLASIACQ